jgi:YVTN family beta-propeller protein
MQVNANGTQQTNFNGPLQITNGSALFDDVTIDMTGNGPGAPYTDQFFNSYYPNVPNTYGNLYMYDSSDTGTPIVAFSPNPLNQQIVMKTIAIGAITTNIAINSVTNTLYAGSSTVLYAFNMTTNTLIASVTLGITGATSVIVNSVTNLIYVSNSATSGAANIVDGATNRLVVSAGATLSLTLGNTPKYGDVNTVTNIIYIANSGASTVSVINGSTNAVTTITVGTGPWMCVCDSVRNLIYVSNYNAGAGNSISVITGTNATVGASISSAGGTQYMAINMVTNYLYCTVGTSPYSLFVINLNPPATSTWFSPSTTSAPTWIVVNPYTNLVYFTEGANGLWYVNGSINVYTPQKLTGVSFTTGVMAINFYSSSEITYDVNNTAIWKASIDGSQQMLLNSSLAITPAISTLNSIPRAIDLTGTTQGGVYFDYTGSVHTMANIPAINTVYAVNTVSNNIAVILNNSVIATISTGVASGAICTNPFTNKVYVGNGGANSSLLVINAITNAISNTINVGGNAYGVCCNIYTNTIYVTIYAGSLIIINGATETITATLTTGFSFSTPVGVCVNPVTNLIYVANNGGSTVTVVDGYTNLFVTTITVGSNPRQICVNPNTNMIIAACSGSNEAYVINGFSNTMNNTTTQSGCIACCVNPTTNVYYLATTTSSTNAAVSAVSQNTISSPVTATSNNVTCNTANNTFYVAGSGGNVYAVNGYTFAVTTISITGAFHALAVLGYDAVVSYYTPTNLINFQIHPVTGNFNGGGVYSALGNGFYPQVSNTMTLGYGTAIWTAIYATTGTVSTSAGKYKHKVCDINKRHALEFIRKLKPKAWNWNHLPEEMKEITNAGFVIEDIREIEPQFEGLRGDDGMHYDSFLGYFAGAIQTIADDNDSNGEKIQELTTELDEMNKEINELKKRIMFH